MDLVIDANVDALPNTKRCVVVFKNTFLNPHLQAWGESPFIQDAHCVDRAIFLEKIQAVRRSGDVIDEYHLGTVKNEAISLILVEPSFSLIHKVFDESCWTPLRPLLPQLSQTGFALYSRALQLSTWTRDHQFCGRCAGSMRSVDEDWARVCSNCEYRSYPRISPCVIGIVKNGDNILLARGARHPEGTFSALAGFIEAGENAEQAFAREVYEEVGVRIKNIRYRMSQAWPFPGQLMLGFVADHAEGDIRVDGVEILEADWFSMSELPKTAPAYTISAYLIAALQKEIQKTVT